MRSPLATQSSEALDSSLASISLLNHSPNTHTGRSRSPAVTSPFLNGSISFNYGNTLDDSRLSQHTLNTLEPLELSRDDVWRIGLGSGIPSTLEDTPYKLPVAHYEHSSSLAKPGARSLSRHPSTNGAWQSAGHSSIIGKSNNTETAQSQYWRERLSRRAMTSAVAI